MASVPPTFSPSPSPPPSNTTQVRALEFDKHVHVDQNHCWTYHRMESGTGRTFKPKPKAPTKFCFLARLASPIRRDAHTDDKILYSRRFRLSRLAALAALPRTCLRFFKPFSRDFFFWTIRKFFVRLFLGIRLAAGVRLELELFSVQNLAGFPLFDGGPSLHGFGDDVGARTTNLDWKPCL